MRTVLSISTVLGIIGVVAAFGLFYLAERVFHLDRDQAQTMMYLKLSVAGHLTIFLTRTRGPFWSIKPAKILWMAVLGTQTVATLIAVYGLFMTPLGWGWAGFVWGYAIVWALINDRIKLLAYKILDRKKVKVSTAVLQKTEDKTSSATAAKAGVTPENKADAKPDAAKAETKKEPEVITDAKPEGKENPKAEVKPVATPEAKAEPKSDDKAEVQPDSKTEAKSDTKPDAKAGSEANPPVDLKPQIAKRAYEIHEQEGNKEGSASQDWVKAESEIRDKEADKTNQPDEVKPATQPEEKKEPEAKTASKPESKEAPASEAKPEIKAEPLTNGDTKPEEKVDTAANLTPQLVKRVHELYEQLGREEVQAVEDLEKAKGTTEK